MTTYLPIGDFARATHLSIKALRHYHDVGILVPAEIDERSGYRYYAPEQVPLALVVRRLRDLDMPLDQVRSVLEASDVEQRNAAIAAHLDRMEQDLRRRQQSVEDLRGLLKEPGPGLPVTLRTVPRATVIAIRDHVQVSDLAQWWAEAFGELFAHLRSQAVTPSGPPGSLYAGELFENHTGEVTAFVPISTPTAESNRLVTLTVPAIEAACAVHEGPLEELDAAYSALGIDIAVRGGIGLPGPIREYYLVSPFDVEDSARLRTEVCWPVFRTVA